MTSLNFENCLQILLANREQTAEKDDLVLLYKKFNEWQPLLHVCFFKTTGPSKPHYFDFAFNALSKNFAFKGEYLFIYLPFEVEEIVCTTWLHSPSKAWLLEGFAHSLCYVAANALLGKQFCLPLPLIEGALAKLLAKGNFLKDGNFRYKYALFTFYPALQNCLLCALEERCAQRI